jgi:hypothetical protein
LWCQAKVRARVKDWPDDFAYTLEKITDVSQERKRLAAACRALWHRVHRVFDPLSGLTPAMQFSASELGFESEDFEDPQHQQQPEFLPRALLFGPVPFDPLAVARALVERLENNIPWPPDLALADPLVSRQPQNTFIAQCQYQAPFVVKLPHGARVGDYAATHRNESTHARLRLRGQPVSREFAFSLQCSDGRTYTDPAQYVERWIALMLQDLETHISQNLALIQARKTLVQDIIAGTRNTKLRRRWIDEPLDQKLQRAAEEHGEHLAHELVFETTLAHIDPDYETEMPELHPRPELVRLLKNFIASFASE